MKRLCFILLPLAFSLSAFGQAFTFRDPAFIRRTAAAGGYTAYATTFAGDVQCWMERDAQLTTVADGLIGSVSFWVNFSGGDGVWQNILTSNGDRVSVTKEAAGNLIRVRMQDGNGVTKIQLDQDSGKVAALTASQGWHWIAASWDNTIAGSAARLYIDGTEALAAGATYSQDSTNLNYTVTDVGIGDYVGGYAPLVGCLSEFWFSTTDYVDWSDSGTRALFSSGGQPADLSSDGSVGSFSQPAIYLRSIYSSFTVNSGFGGDFTKKGTTAFSTCTAP